MKAHLTRLSGIRSTKIVSYGEMFATAGLAIQVTLDIKELLIMFSAYKGLKTKQTL